MLSTVATPFYISTMSVLISSHFCQHLLFSVFAFFLNFIVAILVDVKWYLVVVLIYSSLTINDFEYLFICLLAICISTLGKCAFKSIAHFFNWVACLFVVEF